MKIKRLFGVSVAVLLGVSVVGMTACKGGNDDSSGSSSGGKATITVWCPSEISGLTERQLATFTTNNPDLPYTFTIEPVGEGEAATNMITDVTAGGDIFFFAQDQFARLVQAGALTSVSSSLVDAVRQANDAGSVSAATLNDTLYAYPLTSDNGYFMYYDKTVITEDIVNDQTKIIEACEAAGKQIGFQLSNSGWYAASYFFATGCVSNWTTGSDGEFTGYIDTFNSDKGIISTRGMAELIQSEAYVGSDSASAALFSSGAAVVVSGVWDYTTASNALGENLGCAKLWSFTVDGKSYQLGSFSGNKLLGVKPQTDSTKAAWCQSVANYLTSEACQLERFDENAWGPSNINAQSSEAVQANPALAALAAQSAYATPQGQYPNSWWDASKAIGSTIETNKVAPTDTTGLQAVLNTYSEALADIMDPEEITSLVVTGSLSDAVWDNKAEAYTLDADNTTYADYSSSEPLKGIWEIDVTLEEGGMFRVLKYGTWDTVAGYSHLTSDSEAGLTGNDDDNIVAEVAGTYHVVVDTTGETPTIKVTLKAD